LYILTIEDNFFFGISIWSQYPSFTIIKLVFPCFINDLHEFTIKSDKNKNNSLLQKFARLK